MENNIQGKPNTQLCTEGKGMLPACAPLANPYVPFQGNDPQKYEPSKALIRGTVFSGLDLPFMGMVNNKEKSKTLLHQLQSLSFAMAELGLYLDTHASDQEAIMLFSSYKDLHDELMAEYESKKGPLTQAEALRDGKYTWTENPWPWDIAADRED